MTNYIRNIATLQFGYYEKPMESGTIRYFQAKDFDENGVRKGMADAWLEANEKNERHLLEAGDILFVGKGFRNFAWVYESGVGPAIASSIFYVFRPDLKEILPEYLAIILNSDKYQSFFQTLGAGSSIPSIRKSELESVEIPLPALEEQRKIVKLNQMHQKTIHLYKQIITEKTKLHQSLIQNIVNQ